MARGRPARGLRLAAVAAPLGCLCHARRQYPPGRVSAGSRVPLLSLPAHALGARTRVVEEYRDSQRGILDPLELAPARAGRFRFHRPHQPTARPHRLDPDLAAVGPQCVGARYPAGRRMAESGDAGGRRYRRAASVVEATRRRSGHADGQPRRSGGLGRRCRARYRRRGPARCNAHLRRRSGRAGAQPAGPRRGQERAVDRCGRSALPGRLEKRRRRAADRGRGRVERRGTSHRCGAAARSRAVA